MALAFDVERRSAKIQTWQLVSPPPPVPQSPSQCREKWVARHLAAKHAILNDSPQELAVARLLVLALVDSVELSKMFSKKSVAPERYFKPCCEMERSARCGRAAAARGQFPMLRLRPSMILLLSVRGHLLWACLQGRLLEVKRGLERGFCNKPVPQVSWLSEELCRRAAHHPASDQDQTRILDDDLCSRTLRVVEFHSIEVIEAGSRLKVEASRDRAREGVAVMGSKKAAHAYLKAWKLTTCQLCGERVAANAKHCLIPMLRYKCGRTKENLAT